MAVTITIGGVDRTAYCSFESLDVLQTIAANADVADLIVSVPTSIGWRPKAGNEIVVTNGSTKEFGGIVMTVTETMVGSGRIRYALNCRDYTYLLDRRLVVEEYSAQAASAMVADVIATYASTFSSTGVITSASVSAQRFDYVAPSQAIRTLADILGWGWYVDYDKAVQFFPVTSYVAPVSSIDLDTDVTNYGDLVFEESVGQLKNRVYAKGFDQKSSLSYSQSFVGDGSQKFFFFGYEPSSSTGITATLNGNALSVLTDGIDGSAGDGSGSTSQTFVCFDNMGFRLNTAPTSTETLVISTPYMYQSIVQAEDLASQTEMASREGGDGIHEAAIDDPGLRAPDGSDSLALAVSTRILNRDSMPRLVGSFKSFTQGWRAGQTLQLTSSRRMGGSFNETMYVQEVRKHLVNHPAGGSPVLSYEVSIADSALAI